jgi:cysteinyl-tRNA synthetase
MEWNHDILMNANTGYNNLINRIKILGQEIGEVNQELKERFINNINDDLNIPKALATVNEVFKYGISNADKLATILDFDKVLGLDLGNFKNETIPEEIKTLIKEREKVREEKDWAQSDEIRKKINLLGYEVKDTDSGTKVSKI